MIDLGFLPLQSHRPSVEGLLTWAMQTGAVVSVLIVGVLLIRRPFAKIFGAQAAYALWALPLLRLFVPSVAVPERWLFWRETAVTAASTDTLDPAFLLPLEGIAAPVPSFNWAAFFVASWIIGAVLWLLWQGGVYRRARRDLMKGSYDASARIATVSKDCAKILDLKSTPEILISNANHGPMVLGLLRPLIILPRDFTAHFTPTQQRFALLHELAHIKRRDLWAAAAALLFRAVNWPNPLVHYAHRSFRADQEAACDAGVLSLIDSVDVRQSYGQTLLLAAKLSLKSHTKISDVPIGLTLTHPLKERLMTLKNPIKKASWLTKTAAISAILAGCAASAPYTVAKNDDIISSNRIVMVLDNEAGDASIKYQIDVVNDAVAITKTDVSTGTVTQVDPKTIRGFEQDALIEGGWTFKVEPDQSLTFLHGEAALRWAETAGHPVPPVPPIMVPLRTQPPAPPMVPSNERAITKIEIGPDGSMVAVTSDGAQNSFIKKEDFATWANGEGLTVHANKAKLSAAKSILDDLNTTTLPEARKEIERARKALAEAEAAIEKAGEK